MQKITLSPPLLTMATNLFKNIFASFWMKSSCFWNILVKKKIDLMRKMSLLFPRLSLLTVDKGFFRPHLDYEDVIYDQPNLSSLANKITSVQYNTALAITGAIRRTSTEKLYQELDFSIFRR